LEFELKFVKIWHTTGGKWTKNLNIPRKFEMKNVENFHFLNLKWKYWKFAFLKFEMKISIWNFKNSHITREKWKFWNEEIIYFVYTTEIKLSIIPLYHLCSMYTTVYHMCKLLWNTINSSRHILSYWSFFNSGIGWYGPS
jgi:hypothetical protein